jgi:hypothetical protein
MYKCQGSLERCLASAFAKPSSFVPHSRNYGGQDGATSCEADSGNSRKKAQKAQKEKENSRKRAQGTQRRD